MATAKRVPTYEQLDAMRLKVKMAIIYAGLTLVLGVNVLLTSIRLPDITWLNGFGWTCIAAGFLTLAICVCCTLQIFTWHRARGEAFVRTKYNEDRSRNQMATEKLLPTSEKLDSWSQMVNLASTYALLPLVLGVVVLLMGITWLNGFGWTCIAAGIWALAICVGFTLQISAWRLEMIGEFVRTVRNGDRSLDL